MIVVLFKKKHTFFESHLKTLKIRGFDLVANLTIS